MVTSAPLVPLIVMVAVVPDRSDHHCYPSRFMLDVAGILETTLM